MKYYELCGASGRMLLQCSVTFLLTRATYNIIEFVKNLKIFLNIVITTYF